MTNTNSLLVLLDRACRGVASPTEAEQLRAGVAQLQQRAKGAEQQYELAMEGWNREADAQDQRADRYRAAWHSARRRAHWARCILADYRVEAVARKAKQQACDHRDPNRLGHRRDLAAVCACGHVLFPPPFDPRPDEAQP